MAKQEQTSAPAGTGLVPGLGEAFSINLSTGQGTYVYQLPLPAGVAAQTPKLTLEYAHGVGHGPWGLGWRMGLRNISRRLDLGVPDAENAEVYLDSGSPIVPVTDGSFRALRESTFSRYFRSGEGWRIEDRNGSVHELGLSPDARVADPGHPERVVEWLLERSSDVSGNTIEYQYQMDQGFAYPSAIRYAIYELRFVYEARPDPRQDGRAGFVRRRALRCARIDLVLDPGANERTIRTWEFAYAVAPGSGVSLLQSIVLISRGRDADGSADVRRPPLQFGYSKFDLQHARVQWMDSEGAPPPGLTESDVALVTLDDAPLPGILLNRNGQEYYWANRGQGRWAAPRPLARAPLASSFARKGVAFVDMDGSGTADFLIANPSEPQGYYENNGRAGWGRFVSFPRSNRVSPFAGERNLRLLDVDGNGVVDALATQPRALVWWRNQGQAGWADPVLVPKTAPGIAAVDLQDPDVFLADMTGDGLPDLVRVQSGRVEYWPNLGLGRFGEPIQMRSSPRLRRTPNDVLLFADLDGDGCSELIHISSGQLSLWQNQNGERFVESAVVATVPPPVARTVQVINLDGRAGAGLMWNSDSGRGVRYVRVSFGAETLPYLLTRIENGAGLRSELFYRSAVDDYLRDRDDGRTWSTHFPFPYLVVAGTREVDLVSGRVSETRLRYHEAHFDTKGRRFQGFRTTERVDVGDASRPDSLQVHYFLMAQELEPGNGPEHAHLNGLLGRVEFYQADDSAGPDRAYRVESSEYGLNLLDDTPAGQASRSFVFVKTHRVSDSERTADVRVEEKTYSYDEGGNVIRESLTASGIKGGVAQPTRARVTDIEYAAASARYLAGKPARTTVRGDSGQLLAEKRFFYDDQGSGPLPAGQANRGLLSRVEEWVMTQVDFDAHYSGMSQSELGYISGLNADGIPSVFSISERTRHDARGLPVSMKDALGNESSVQYDSSGLFRIGLRTNLGLTRFEYDQGTGQPTRIVYPDGATALFEYDAQGRLIRAAAAGETLAEAAAVHTYDENRLPNCKQTRFRQVNGESSLSCTYFDGYGKAFQQRVEVEPGKVLVAGLQRLNPWGQVAEEFEPSFATQLEFGLPETTGRPSRKIFYDALGRVIRSLNYNGGESTALIEPFRVATRDANDNDSSPENVARGQFDTPHIEEFDVLRYLVRATEVVGPGRAVVTDYDVGPMGELLGVSDGRGQKFRYRYDQTGNRLEIRLRDAGDRKLWYDAGKKLVRTLDGQGHDLRAEWDQSGRMRRLLSGSLTLEEYTYDIAAQNAFGRLGSVSYPGGSQSFEYDANGRLARHEYRWEGFPAATGVRYEYDPLGREIACIHDDGTRLEKQRLFNGWIKALPGVLKEVEWNARGLPAAIRFQNDLVTECEYTPGPGRLSRQTTRAPGGAILEDVQFTLDRLEMLLGRQGVSPGVNLNRQFAYDPLYQLTSQTSLESGAPATSGYDYVNDYNLARFQEAQRTLEYLDPQRPDRLTGITPDGQARFELSYDGNGNVLTLPGQQFEYNAKNELVHLVRQDGLEAIYRYDHHGLRVSKRVAPASGDTILTRYLGERAEFRSGAAAGLETIYHIHLGQRRVARIRNGVVEFLHEDGLGSVAFVTDSAAQVIGRIDQLPYGTVASQQGVVEPRTYCLHPVDEESGLVYMRRRYYAPALGRFITPDLMAVYQPDQLLHHPASLHLYAYVANDPLNKTDPTGLSFWSVVGMVVGVAIGVAAGIALVGLTGGLIGVFGVAGLLMGMGIILGVSLAAAGISYAIAANLDNGSGPQEFLRGMMIGFNAGMNGAIAAALFCPYAGIALGVIGALAAIDTVAQNHVYQGILGWSSWVMPMSWTITAVGLVFFAVNLVAAGISWNGDWYWSGVKIEKLKLDWRTGTFVMAGGWTSPGRGNRALGYNLGNFVFVNPSTLDDGTFDEVMRHETGHTLNTAAFGTGFEAMTLIDQIIVNSGHEEDAYGEMLAESIVNRTSRPTIPMWG